MTALLGMIAIAAAISAPAETPVVPNCQRGAVVTCYGEISYGDESKRITIRECHPERPCVMADTRAYSTASNGTLCPAKDGVLCMLQFLDVVTDQYVSVWRNACVVECR